MKKIEHIGIAVSNLKKSNELFTKIFGKAPYKTEVVESEGVSTSFFLTGENKIELLEATSPDSPVAKFIEKRGEGIHHIALSVDNIEEALERFRAAGVRLIDSIPRKGAHNTRVAFIHPSTTHGVLLELVEHGK